MPSPSAVNQPSASNRVVYLAAGIAAVGGLLWGYDLAVIGGAILFIKREFALSTTMQEVVVSAALLGAMLGAATGATFANRLGRRQFLLLMAVVNVAGVLGTVLAPTVGWLIASRALTGAAFGIVAFTAPL